MNPQKMKDRIDELERILGLRTSLPTALGLTPMHEEILGMLLARQIVSKEAIYTALYGNMNECDQPEYKVVEVHICNMRRKLKKHGINISTRYNAGYFLTPEDKSLIESHYPAKVVFSLRNYAEKLAGTSA